MKKELSELKALSVVYSEEAQRRTIQIIKELLSSKFRSGADLLSFHDTLLFLSAYPSCREIKKLAALGLKKILDLLNSDGSLREKTVGSGLPGASLQAALSLTLVKKMLREFPGKVFLHSFGEGVHPREICRHALDEMEFELAGEEKSNAMGWLQKAAGTRNRSKMLEWLVGSVDLLDAGILLKEQLFESMTVFVEVRTEEESFSRSLGKLETKSTYYHNEILKRFDERKLISRNLPAPIKLDPGQRQRIISVAANALCLLNRETDPVTYCEPRYRNGRCIDEGVRYYELERGLSIALFSIHPPRRLPLESYLGFMMFKNGHPVSYGGSWLFGERALIGINIFEAFRGGESAYVFAQLLRTYHKGFGANYFEVEPYQFGKNNPEGIASGAFWFYYRFGFRSVNKELSELAEKERQKINTEKGYRSSPETLRKFTAANMGATFGKTKLLPSPGEISLFITGRINEDFAGNRKKAKASAIKELKTAGVLRRGIPENQTEKLLLFFSCCTDLKKTGASLIQKLLLSKTGNEFDYAVQLSRNMPVLKKDLTGKHTFYPNLR